jgi:mannose-6-phosphate isomerase-like protein (cupin superfamily)
VGYTYRKRSEAPVNRTICGSSARVVSWQDTDVASIHVVHILDSERHVHRATTEYYYILEGAGKMELAGDVLDVESGDTILIEPGTPHRAWGNLTTVVFGVPSWNPDDQFPAP